MIEGHPNVDPSITFEASGQTIDLKELDPGQCLAVTFGEGQDCTDQARLTLELISPAADKAPAKFKVLDADLDASVVAKNIRADMREPGRMGGELWVRFACTYRHGYMPPISLAQNDAISKGRHVFCWIPNPAPELPDQGITYHAEVLELRLF